MFEYLFIAKVIRTFLYGKIHGKVMNVVRQISWMFDRATGYFEMRNGAILRCATGLF